MSLKVKLISCISLFMLMVGVLIIGVFAATQQQLTMQGSVSFNVPDKSLYVKDVRLKQDMASEPTSIDSFMPGYINGDFTLDLTGIADTNTHGSFSLYFDIINTTDIQWTIVDVYLPDTLTSQGVSASYSGVIATNDLTDTDSDGYKNFDSSTPIDGSLILTITAPNSDIVDLQGIVVTIDEPEPNIVAISSNETLGIAQGAFAEIGDDVTISADFTGNADADFLGWRAGSVDGELVSTLSDYTFTYTEESPTTYYAIFTEPNEYLNYTYNTPATGEAQLSSCSAEAVDIIVPSEIYRTSQSASYVVTSLYSASSSSSGVFYQTRSTLQSVSLPETITSIGNYAFSNCSSLKSVTFGDNSQLTSIGERAFLGCSGLTSITIPEGVTSIGVSAFWGCRGLTGDLVIPEGVTSIGEDAFFWCDSLTSIIISEGVTSIGQSAFNDCSGLIEITLPSSLTSIDRFAFQDCSSLTSITIPEGVTSISDYVFRFCSGLTSITIPEGVTSIGRSAFEDCSGLTSVDLSDHTRLTSIGISAFDGCSGLKSIIIPEGVTSIGNYAFRNCTSLTSITINATTPPTLGSSAIPSNVTNIYVPAASVATYQKASGWSSFASKISAIQ